MQIRKASDSDSEQIAALLKLSLGEISSPKSLDTWRWKHAQNPFGPSEVLVAEENGELAGVRAMMPWTWQSGHQQYKTYRAVDTAVHPKHQGKGLFTKLTLQMINDLAEANAAFVFNTPNQQSLPGYLKMGWKKWGRIPVHFCPSFLFSHSERNKLNEEPDSCLILELCQQWNDQQTISGKFFTPKSPQYLKWRYIDNPIIDYVTHMGKDVFIAGYVKKRKWFNELRICEWIADPRNQQHKKILSDFVQNVKSHNKVDVITLSQVNARLFGLSGLSVAIGPVLTIRNLLTERQLPALSSWSPVLGDLELL